MKNNNNKRIFVISFAVNRHIRRQAEPTGISFGSHSDLSAINVLACLFICGLLIHPSSIARQLNGLRISAPTFIGSFLLVILVPSAGLVLDG